MLFLSQNPHYMPPSLLVWHTVHVKFRRFEPFLLAKSKPRNETNRKNPSDLKTTIQNYKRFFNQQCMPIKMSRNNIHI